MNKKIITSCLTTGVFFPFVFASSASAFWPFDALFKKSGDVKAETSDRAYIPERMPQSGKAYMTYQTLVSLNDTCRKMFSQTFTEPTRPKITPSTRETTAQAKMNSEDMKKMYEMELGVDMKSESELNSIYNNLKARCDNIANLTTRMQRIYKGQSRPTPMSSERLTPTTVKVDDGATRPTIIKYGEDGMERPTPTKRPIINFKIKDENKD